MSATLDRPVPPTEVEPPRTGERERVPEASPVAWWAVLGLCFLLFALYLWVRWVVSGDFKPVPEGPTPIPTWMLISIRTVEVGSVLGFLWVGWRYIVRPWRVNGRLGWDGLFTLACGTLWWQDFLQNYGQVHSVWNAHMINFGSWFQFIPGWMSPNASKMAESPLFAGTWYFAILMLLVVGTNKLMWKAKARWPRLGAGQMFLIAVLIGAVMDAILDPLYVRLGLYTWAGALKSWTLWYGHYYAFPLYEIPTIALWFGATAWIRFARDDKGLSFVERGIDRIRVGGAKTKTFIRFLALTAIVNVLFLVFYNLPLGLVSLHSTWSRDDQSRSYFTEGMCGPGTTYACPSSSVPVSYPGTVHLSPNGKLVVPRGARLPVEVPWQR